MGLTVRKDIFQSNATLDRMAYMVNIQETIEDEVLPNQQKDDRKMRKEREHEEEGGVSHDIYIVSTEKIIPTNVFLPMPRKKVKLDSAKETKENTMDDRLLKEDSGKAEYSSHMKDSVQSQCQICSQPQNFKKMRLHTKFIHGVNINDYKKKYGPIIDHIVKIIYHKCRICSKDVLLDSDTLGNHVRTHGITHKAYSEKYITLRKPALQTTGVEVCLVLHNIGKNNVFLLTAYLPISCQASIYFKKKCF